MIKEQIKVSDWLQPVDGDVSSAVRVISVNEKGCKLRRCNLIYNNEEFFLTWELLKNSKWIQVPNNTQLQFL